MAPGAWRKLSAGENLCATLVQIRIANVQGEWWLDWLVSIISPLALKLTAPKNIKIFLKMTWTIWICTYTPRKKFTWNLRIFHPWYPGKSSSQSYHFQVRFVNLLGVYLCWKLFAWISTTFTAMWLMLLFDGMPLLVFVKLWTKKFTSWTQKGRFSNSMPKTHERRCFMCSSSQLVGILVQSTKDRLTWNVHMLSKRFLRGALAKIHLSYEKKYISPSDFIAWWIGNLRKWVGYENLLIYESYNQWRKP